MASPEELCNTALVEIGDFRINSFGEGTELARKCEAVYDKNRRSMLRAHSWNFASVAVQLARVSEPPVTGFDYRYRLPTDFIRLVSISSDVTGITTFEYKLRGNDLHSSANEVFLEYVSDFVEVARFPSDFEDALTYAVARDLAIPVAQSRGIREDMKAEYKDALRRAISTDSVEDFSNILPSGSWTDIRFGSVGRGGRRI